MCQLIDCSLSELFVCLKCVTIEAIRTNSLVEVAHTHCLFNVICAKVCALTVVMSALTDDHSVGPFVWCLVYGFEVLFDVSVDIIFVIYDLIIISCDLHDDGVRRFHSQHSLGCLVESLHVTAA